jgi:putative peptidoglycan lipid II flippase
VRAEEGDDAARRFFAAIRGVSIIALLIATALGILGAPLLVELFAGGMHVRPGAFERTVVLTRWVFPYILFMGTAALGMAALNSYGRFAVAAFAPALLNVAFIVACFTLPAWFVGQGEDRILALAVGVLVGGVLQVVAQWPALRRIGFAAPPKLDFRNPHVRDALRRMLPMMIGIGIYTIDLMLSRRFLSQLPEGSQSYFSYAMRLCDFPQGIFVLALQAAALPSLAKLVASGQLDEVAKTYAYGMRLCLFVALPATALFVALARPLVVALFERGAFDSTSSTETARALVAQGLGLWIVAAVRQILPVFYALGDTRTPVIVSAVDLVAFIASALVLRALFGHTGVGMAVTLSSAVQMLLLWFGLGRRLPSLRLGEIGASAARTASASVVAGLAGYFAADRTLRFAPSGALGRALPGMVGATVFAAVFLAVATLVKSAELASLTSAVRRRIRR